MSVRQPRPQLTPNQKMRRSMFLAVEQLHLAAEAKRKRMAEYGKADPNDQTYEHDFSVFNLTRDNPEADHSFQNEVLGIGNQMRPSELFKMRNTGRVWHPGSLIPRYNTQEWLGHEINAQALPLSVFKPGKTCDIMAVVQKTMEQYYVHHEDRAIAKGIMENRPEEDAFDGVCTTGFAIDGIPFHQPQLEPILMNQPQNILNRLPVHTFMEINPNPQPSVPNHRVTLTVYSEKVFGFGFDKNAALRDGCMKLQYMFQHALDCHDFDAAFWHPLPPKELSQQRNKVEMNITNLLRSKIPDGNIEIEETAPRLFQASCTIDGLKIEAQSYSKKLAKKRLYLFLMMLMPKVLQTLDVSEWLGDGAGFAPDATYGITESQRGQKRGPGLYETEIPAKKAKQKIVTLTTEDDQEIKTLIEKHVTSYTTMMDGTGFPINIHNKRSGNFFLSHRCQNRHKFNKIDKKITDKVTVILELPDATEYEGCGKSLEMAKHLALLTAHKESTLLKQKEPMTTHGICAYGLMQDLCTNVRIHCKASQDNSVWTCEIEATSDEGGKQKETKTCKTDFTKKGAQRLAALDFLKKFNDVTKKAWEFAIIVAQEKLQKSDGVDKGKMINIMFQWTGLKKPTKNEAGVINYEIYGWKSQVQSTGDTRADDELIYEDVKNRFPFLTVRYEICPLKMLTQKLVMNQSLRDLKWDMLKWDLIHYDAEIKYFRVSLTLPSKDRFVGEGSSLKNAQKNAAHNCLTQHPVLKLGDDTDKKKNYWNTFITTIKRLPCQFKCEVISGVENCPQTLYCRVRLSCFRNDNNEKIFESTAAGISKGSVIQAHAQDRAAQRLMEEPTYGNKPVLNIIHDRGLQVQFVLEQRKENEVMQKCLMKYWPTKNKDDSPYEFTAEGLSVKLAKGKAIEKFLKQTFGPDLSKKKEREITSIRMIKPVNRDGCDDPPLPPSARSRGDRKGDCPDSVPDMNAQQRLKYEQATERHNKRMANKTANDMD